jgi:hypothetical protein
VALAVLVLGLHFVSGVLTFYDVDLFHGLALAREIVRDGRIPTHDVFAYTPTLDPVVHHEWLAALLFYAVATHAGAAGMLVLKYTLEIGMMVLVLALAHRQGARLPTLVFLAPVGMAFAWPGMTTIRAQVLTMCFVVVLLRWLDDDRRGARGWMLPFLVLYVVWLNCHGGFVVGPALIAVHAIEQALRGRPVRHLVALLVACGALVVATPYGVAYYAYLWRALRMDRSAILEWQPLGTGNLPAFLPFGMSLVVLVYLLLTIGFEATPGWLLVLFSALAALRFQRHVSIYALVWLAVVPPAVQRARLGVVIDRLWSARPPLTAAVLVLGLGLAGSRVLAARPWHLRLSANPGDGGLVLFPAGAVEYVRGLGVDANMLVPFEVGGYVSWMLYPHVKVSLDSRYEVAYPPALLGEHTEFYRAGRDWHAILDRYPTDLALVPVGWPVDAKMRDEAAWSLVYRDDAYELFARPGLDLPHVDRRGVRIVGRFP